ncbi:MAG: hypothetical protein J1F71_02655 [Clostridiales bacterium]|nr:hypothetical protein [Clostridiales bacterium]
MAKILTSKWFVMAMTLISLTLTIVVGVLLGYQPNTAGTLGVSNGYGSGKIATEYVFNLKIAAGYWCIGIIVTIAVCLLCILIKKAYSQSKDANEDRKNNE